MAADARILRAKVSRAIAGYALLQGDFDRAGERAAAARRDYERFVDDAERGRSILSELSLLDTVDATLALARGEVDAAEAAYRRAIANSGRAAELGEPYHLHRVAQLNLAKTLRQLQRYDEALALADDVLADEAAVLADREMGWPVSRMVLAMARAERFRGLQLAERDTEARAAFPDVIAALDDVVRDYPDAADARTLRAATRANFARALRADEHELSVSLLDRAAEDLHHVLERNADDAQASHFLIQVLRTLAYRMRQEERWHRLEPVARELGELRAPGAHVETAARDLVRCAAAAEAARAERLLDEAMQLLLIAQQSGVDVLVDDELYAPLHADPRWAELMK
jgi:tetratricopeptide (TPR) repeat protein